MCYENRTVEGQRRIKLTEEQRKDIANRYQNLERMADIASNYGVTRQAVFKVLKQSGIDTSKSQRVERSCHTCGTTVSRRRGRARNTTRTFCSHECYVHWLNTLGETYNPSNYHSRIAREVVRKHFDYQPENGHIIHHINKDCTDNRKVNLMVFSSQSDHLKFHRGFQSAPLWDGRIN